MNPFPGGVKRADRSTEDFLMSDNLVHNEVVSQHEMFRAMAFSVC
jgi:hypothetical protein